MSSLCGVIRVTFLPNTDDQISSKELFSALEKIRSNPEIGKNILDIRGQGLMVAVEFASPTGSGPYDALVNKSAPSKLSSRIAKRCQEKGMLILTTSVFEVIRFIPPCNVSKADLEKGSRIFEEAVREVVREG